MFDLIISILVSLNIHYSIVEENGISVQQNDYEIFTTSEAYIVETRNGNIHNLEIVPNDQSNSQIIFVPEIDPKERE